MAKMQEGNFVSVDSRGKRTSVPMSQCPKATATERPRGVAMGANNRANNAARKEAGMKKGGVCR